MKLDTSKIFKFIILFIYIMHVCAFYSPIKVVKISKQTRWLFWKSLTNGNARTGRYCVSPKIGDQCASADSILYRTLTIK